MNWPKQGCNAMFGTVFVTNRGASFQWIWRDYGGVLYCTRLVQYKGLRLKRALVRLSDTIKLLSAKQQESYLHKNTTQNITFSKKRWR
jgi:hypothetical protein